MNTHIDQQYRYDAIDKLRGFIIVLMAIDHVRIFFSPYNFQPENLELTNPELFFTRWITHFCAPVFIFLAGMGVFLFQSKGHSKNETAHYLLSRGIWLIFLELALVNLSWQFSYSPVLVGQVIWVIGWCMVILAGFIYLPIKLMAITGLIMLLGHNLFDSVNAQDFTHLGWLWSFLHQRSYIPFNNNGFGIFIVYPLIPWLGVMVLGYCFSAWLMNKPKLFVKRCLYVGTIMTIGFLLLRWSNWYGDSNLWQYQSRGTIFTVLSFLNVTKYPPSLLYVLMTVGPAIIVLGIMHKYNYEGFGILKTFGRVPFFFYMLHVPIIHTAAIVYFKSLSGTYIGWQYNILIGLEKELPIDYEPSLIRLYIVWFLISVFLYGLCYWYKGIKQRHNFWLFRYL